MTPFPIAEVRAAFPALREAGDFIFFDNAAGAQAPTGVLEAVREHLRARNVQRGGRYRQSREVDEAIARARESVALLVNAREPGEVAFGMNATSFIRLVSQAVGQTFGERREIVVTDMDHEANVATWLALEPLGARIQWWRMRDDGRLHSADLEPLLSPRTRLVACTLASNAIGSIVDAAAVSTRVHAAGAELFLDAVHYAPHGPIDVQAFGCDYLVSSGYKIFSPHMGFLWGRKEALDALPTFREYFIPDTAPAKFEVGTYVYENVAGMDAAVGYLEDLGRRMGAGESRRAAIVQAMEAIREYEAGLSRAFLERVGEVPGIHLYGLRETAGRTPTFCFNLSGKTPAEAAQQLAARGIGVRDGHMYSPRLIRRLGLAEETGAVRASLVHYNTVEEIERLAETLRDIEAGS